MTVVEDASKAHPRDPRERVKHGHRAATSPASSTIAGPTDVPPDARSSWMVNRGNWRPAWAFTKVLET